MVADLVALAIYGSKNWTHGSKAPGSERRTSRSAIGSGLEINLKLGFKGRGGWIDEGEDRKIYLLGKVKNSGSKRVERLLLEALIQDADSLGDLESHEIVLGPFEPGESQEYEDLVTYLLPSGEDARGNEVFEFSYDLRVVSVE